jgi:hypothetical protein
MEGAGPAPDGNVWTGYNERLAGRQGLASDSAIQFEVEPVDSFAIYEAAPPSIRERHAEEGSTTAPNVTDGRAFSSPI